MPELNHLIKVLLVDDEDKTRDLLKMLVDWKALGFELIGEASSGQEGLQILEEVQPDLVLTDIKMPFMDGLQLAKLVLQRYPGTKIIILSAYEDFGYAQQSIQIGVADYLLKPIKREKLQSVLLNIRSKIEEELDLRQEYANIKEQLTTYRSVMQEKFLNELLHLDKSSRGAEQKIQYFSMEGIRRYVQAAVVSCREECPELSGEKKIIYDMIYMDIVKNYFQNKPDVYVFTDQMQNIVIANTDEAMLLHHACEEIKNRISAKMQRDVSIGVGTACSGTCGLMRSYQEACEALKYCIIYGNKSVLLFQDVSLSNNGTLIRENSLADIELFVRAGLRKETVEAIHAHLVQPPLEAIEDKNAVKVNCINIVTLLINIASDMQLPFESERIASLHADITAMSSISQVEDHLIDFAENIVMGIQNARREKNNTLIDKVLSYINEHMADSTLGLSSLSAQFYTNSSYLSRTFKHKVGYTVVEYLTMQRIKKAKMLLKEGDKMAYEIGEAVGIPDPNYFGKCFKKYAGCSIQEYRKRIELNTGSDTITKNV